MAKIEGNPFSGFRGKLGNLVGYNWKGLWCVRSRPAQVRNPRSEAQQRHRAMFAEEVRLAGRMSWAVNLGFAAVADELHITPQNAFVKANQGAFSSAARLTPPCPPQGGTVEGMAQGGTLERGSQGGTVEKLRDFETSRLREVETPPCPPQGGTLERESQGGTLEMGSQGGTTEMGSQGGTTVEGNANGGLLVDWSALIISAGPVAPIALGVPTLDGEGVLSVAFEKNPYHLHADSFDQVHLYVYCPALNDGYLAAPVYRKERHVSVALPGSMVGQVLHVYAFVTDREGRASETCYASIPEAAETPNIIDMPDVMEMQAIPETEDIMPLQESADTLAEAGETAEESQPDECQLSLFAVP